MKSLLSLVLVLGVQWAQASVLGAKCEASLDLIGGVENETGRAVVFDVYYPENFQCFSDSEGTADVIMSERSDFLPALSHSGKFVTSAEMVEVKTAGIYNGEKYTFSFYYDRTEARAYGRFTAKSGEVDYPNWLVICKTFSIECRD